MRIGTNIEIEIKSNFGKNDNDYVSQSSIPEKASAFEKETESSFPDIDFVTKTNSDLSQAATKIPVCSNFRANRHKVFEGLANWGKSSIGWFFGFKLHLIINDKGELLSFKVTPGNVDDRVPVKDLVKELFGKIYGDKGYISSKLFEELFENGVKLITPFKSNMKNCLLPFIDKIMLRKRSLIETVNDQLKNISQISHSRHRSVLNFMVNIIAGLIAYTHQEKKPSLNLLDNEYFLLPSTLIPSESYLF